MIKVGQVRNKSSRPFSGDYGEVVLHSFQLEGDRTFYGTGKVPVPAENGETIQFATEQKGKNTNVIMSTVEKVENQVASAPKPTSATSSTGGSGYKGYASKSEFFDAKDAYWDNKEKHDKEVVAPRINFSASQRDAIALVVAALENDCLSLGAAKGKRLDLLLEQVDKVTERFVEQREATAKEAT